jgi:hypothetical protein
MQQHSYPSHSKHFVFPAPASPLTREPIVDEAAEPGPLRSTSVVLEEEHILAAWEPFLVYYCVVLVCGGVCEAGEGVLVMLKMRYRHLNVGEEKGRTYCLFDLI